MIEPVGPCGNHWIVSVSLKHSFPSSWTLQTTFRWARWPPGKALPPEGDRDRKTERDSRVGAVFVLLWPALSASPAQTFILTRTLRLLAGTSTHSGDQAQGAQSTGTFSADTQASAGRARALPCLKVNNTLQPRWFLQARRTPAARPCPPQKTPSCLFLFCLVSSAAPSWNLHIRLSLLRSLLWSLCPVELWMMQAQGMRKRGTLPRTMEIGGCRWWS